MFTIFFRFFFLFKTMASICNGIQTVRNYGKGPTVLTIIRIIAFYAELLHAISRSNSPLSVSVLFKCCLRAINCLPFIHGEKRHMKWIYFFFFLTNKTIDNFSHLSNTIDVRFFFILRKSQIHTILILKIFSFVLFIYVFFLTSSTVLLLLQIHIRFFLDIRIICVCEY